MLKAESSKKVTPAQIKFVHLLHECGPMTANELAGGMDKSIQYAHEIIHALLEAGIIEKTLEGIDMNTERRLAWKFKLSVSIDCIGIKTRQTSRRIPDEETRYAAILRNGKMTGQELQNQFKTVYPARSRGSISNIIQRARQKGWCR